MSSGTFYFEADDGHKIHVYKWADVENPKAVLQITHGAVEHAKRYEELAKFLNKQGIVAYAQDLRGHGKTAEDAKVPYFSDKDGGWDLLVEDMHKLTGIIKEEYRELPVFLLGHSMGSFLAVSYYAKYGAELKGGILSGTGTNSEFMLRFLINLADRDIKKHGYRHTAPFLHNLTFGSLNNKIKGAESPYDFICTDRTVIDAYIKDEYCGNTATSEFLKEMSVGVRRLNDMKTYENTPNELSIFIVSGEFDPLGGKNQKCMQNVYERYIAAGLKDVTKKVYKGMRHEILNEPGRQEVFEDFLKYVNGRL